MSGTRALITETFSTRGGKTIPVPSLRWQSQWKWLHSYRHAWRAAECVKVTDTRNRQEPDLDWKAAFIFNLPIMGDCQSSLTFISPVKPPAALLISTHTSVNQANPCNDKQGPKAKKLNSWSLFALLIYHQSTIMLVDPNVYPSILFVKGDGLNVTHTMRQNMKMQ